MRRLCWPLLPLLFLAWFWGGGRAHGELADMTAVDAGDYVAIQWEGRTYVPFGAVSPWERGRLLGIVDGDERDQVYAWRDHSPREWAISYYDSGLMPDAMLMREKRVTDIPPGRSSEYFWNP